MEIIWENPMAAFAALIGGWLAFLAVATTAWSRLCAATLAEREKENS